MTEDNNTKEFDIVDFIDNHLVAYKLSRGDLDTLKEIIPDTYHIYPVRGCDSDSSVPATIEPKDYNILINKWGEMVFTTPIIQLDDGSEDFVALPVSKEIDSVDGDAESEYTAVYSELALDDEEFLSIVDDEVYVRKSVATTDGNSIANAISLHLEEKGRKPIPYEALLEEMKQ